MLATSAIARMNLLLHGVEDFKIIREDTLRNPAFYTANHLAQFDCVVANPPFSLKNRADREAAADSLYAGPSEESQRKNCAKAAA